MRTHWIYWTTLGFTQPLALTHTYTVNPVHVMKSMDPGSIWALWNLIEYLAPHQTQFLCLYPRRELQGRKKKNNLWMDLGGGDMQGPQTKKDKPTDCPVVLSLHLCTLVSCARTQCPWAPWCSAEVVIVITAMDKKAHADIHPPPPRVFQLYSPIRHGIKTCLHPSRNTFLLLIIWIWKEIKKAKYTTKCL